MNAGKLRHQVRFDHAVDTIDDTTGEPVRSWTVVGNAWARVEPLRGREAVFGNGVDADRDTRIVARWSPTLGALREKDRAIHGGIYYNIVSVIHDGMNRREIAFMCKSGLNAG